MGMTAAGRHRARIHGLRCVVCAYCYGRSVPSLEAHHLEYVRGEWSDWAIIPLCGECHHELHEHRRRAFYLAHKLTDVKLLAWTVRELLA